MGIRAAIWDAPVKDMRWGVCGSSSWSPKQEVTSDMKFTGCEGIEISWSLRLSWIFLPVVAEGFHKDEAWVQSLCPAPRNTILHFNSTAIAFIPQKYHRCRHRCRRRHQLQQHHVICWCWCADWIVVTFFSTYVTFFAKDAPAIIPWFSLTCLWNQCFLGAVLWCFHVRSCDHQENE